MKLLSWKCQGSGKPKTVRALKKLISDYHPDVVFVMEIKQTNANCKKIHSFRELDKSTIVDCATNGKGGSGGLTLLWNSLKTHIDIIHSDSNYIDFRLTLLSSNTTMRATGIYGYP